MLMSDKSIDPKWPTPENKVVPVDPPLLGKSLLEFWGHALEQMKVRGISEEKVIRVIRAPSETGLPTQMGRHRVRKHGLQDKATDVVYEIHEDRIVIVTAISKDWSKKKK